MTLNMDKCPKMSMENCPVVKWTKIHQVSGMTKSFRTALIDALEANKASVAELARATGVSNQQIHKVKQGKSKSTNVDDAVKIASFFGKSLDEFLEDPTIREDVELASLLSQLKPTERQFLINAAKAQIASRDQMSEQSDEDK